MTQTKFMIYRESQGGRGGRPWAQLHADKRCKHLKWWANRLGLSSLGDLVDILPCVENASWTKNRTGGFQKLPGSLVARLHAYVQSGGPDALYARSYARRDAKLKAPANPLLYVPSSLSRDFDKDLHAAGIPKRTPAGKVDFHACRVAYINLIMQSGATAKEAQELARHATPHMTMNVYGRARGDRLAEAVESVANRIQSEQKHVPSMYRQAIGAEIENATPSENTRLRPIANGGAEGNRSHGLSMCYDCMLTYVYDKHTP